MAEITMPKLSDTMTEGTLIAWKKKAGDKVSSGEVIAEVETDKATMEMEAFEDGVLVELVPEGTKVAVGEKIAVIQGKGRGQRLHRAPRLRKPKRNNRFRPWKKRRWPPGRKPGQAAPNGQEGASGGRVKASPLAKKVAMAQGVPLGGLCGVPGRGAGSSRRMCWRRLRMVDRPGPARQ